MKVIDTLIGIGAFFSILNYAIAGNSSKPQITFESWCDDWQLDCSLGDSDVSNYTSEDYETIKAFYKIGKNVIADQNIVFKSEEFKYREFERTADVFEAINFISYIPNFLDTHGISSLETSNGTFLFSRQKAPPPSEVELNNGVKIKISGNPSIVLEEELTFDINGFSIGSIETGDLEIMQNIRIMENFNLALETETLIIENIPPEFLDVFDVDWENLENLIDQTEAIKALPDLLNWLTNFERKTSILKSHLNQVSDEIWRLVDPSLVESAREFLSVLEKLEIKKGENIMSVYTTEKGIDRECRFFLKPFPPLVLELKKDFGVRKLEETNLGARMEVFGIKGKVDILGPLDPNFTFKSLRLEKDKIILEKIPVIGEFPVDIKNIKKQELRVVCS